MFGQFDEAGRAVLDAAYRVSREHEGRLTGTEHLLLALLEQGFPDVAGREADRERLRATVAALIPRGFRLEYENNSIPTASFNRVLELAREEAQGAGRAARGPRELVLALIREPMGHGGRLLREAGFTGLDLRAAWGVTWAPPRKIEEPEDEGWVNRTPGRPVVVREAPEAAEAAVARLLREHPGVDRFGDDLPPGAYRRIGSSRFRHPGAADSQPRITLSPDGTRLASAGSGVLCLWDTNGGRLLWQLTGLDDLLTANRGESLGQPLFAPAGDILAAPVGDEVWLWEAATGKRLLALGHPELGWPQGLSFGPAPTPALGGGLCLAAAFRRPKGPQSSGGPGRSAVLVWEAATGRTVLELLPPAPDAPADNGATFHPTEEFSAALLAPVGGEIMAGSRHPSGSGMAGRGWCYDPNHSPGRWLWGIDWAHGEITTFATVGAGEFSGVAAREGFVRLHGGPEKCWSVRGIDVTGFVVLADGSVVAVGLSAFSHFRDSVVTIAPTDAGAFHYIEDSDAYEAFLEARTNWHLPVPAKAAAVAAGGTAVATCDDALLLRVYDYPSGRERAGQLGTPAAVDGLAFTPDGKTLMAYSRARNEFLLWRADTGGPRGRISINGLFAHARDGSRYAVAGAIDCPDADGCVAPHANCVHVIAAASHAVLLEFTAKAARSPVGSLGWSPDGETLALGFRDGTVAVYESRTGRHVRNVGSPAHEQEARAAYSDDGRWVVSWSNFDGAVHLWDAATGAEDTEFRLAFTSFRKKQRRRDEEGGPWHLALSPTGDSLLWVPEESTRVYYWDRSSPKTIQKAPPMARAGSLRFSSELALLFLPGGRAMAAAAFRSRRATKSSAPRSVGRGDRVILWDARTGAVLKEFPAPGHTAVALSPDGKTLATGGADTTVLLWDISDL